MVVSRRAGAWVGSALVHGVLLIAALVYAPVIPASDPPVEVEIIELTTLSSPAAPRTEDPGTQADVIVAAPPPPPARLELATRKPVKPHPAPPPIAIPPEPPPPPEPLPAASEPAPPEPSSAPPVGMLARPIAITRGYGNAASGMDAGNGGDEDAFDRSAYGAAIVRILKSEIDRHPVPGISARDSIQVVLTLLPSGELAWTREGRYGFAEVLRGTLGPLRLRQILKRIEIASARFPPHPHGLRSRHYTVDITINFSAPRR